MNSANIHELRAAQPSGAAPDKCIVCGDPIAEHCFCKIHREEAGPIRLCCPDCAIQYIHAARPPADTYEQELLAFEDRVHFPIGDDNP